MRHQFENLKSPSDDDFMDYFDLRRKMMSMSVEKELKRTPKETRTIPPTSIPWSQPPLTFKKQFLPQNTTKNVV